MIGARPRPGDRPGDRGEWPTGPLLPALLSLTLVAGLLEALGAIVFAQPALATAALATALFAATVTLAVHEIQAGRPVRARIALAVSLTLLGAIGSFMIPGVGHAVALLPVLSAILVLRYVHRGTVVLVVLAAVGSAIVILVLDKAAGPVPAIEGSRA